MKKIIYPALLIIIIFTFFYKVFLHNLLPIPADTIIGLYHPFRDLYAEQYPNGIPFKNFLITDPVRQQYPWRELAISLLKRGEAPLWNPYSFTGTALLGNLQSAPFYPLNAIFFILPFKTAWSILIILQPILAGIFMYLYLKQTKLHKLAAFLGGISYAFSGFFIAWLEWNTILHVTLWLPLALLSIEKIIANRNLLLWSGIFIFSIVSAFFAGHLQIFFYFILIVLAYFTLALHSTKERKKLILLFAVYGLLITIITLPQWLPTAKFVLHSGRGFDQITWQKERWFIPAKHLVQFLAPDFFGNPTTLNYWGVWNYGEFIGYIGVVPLFFALLAIFFRRDKKTLFIGSLGALGLLFATPNPIAKLPFQLAIPFISTSQPTRLLFIVDFSLVILAALGFDLWLRGKVKFNQVFKIIIPIGVLYGLLWLFTEFGTQVFNGLSTENLHVSQRNLILPTALFVITVATLFTHGLVKNKKLLHIAHYALLITIIFDLFRFGWKFTPFTKQEYLFPSTAAIEFLQKQKQPFRIMTADKRILPPNFSVIYRLQDVAGYDPLYLRDYGELTASWVRNKPDISPFQFNRIITPQNYKSNLADLLNVKYILSLNDIRSEKLAKIFEEGQTKIYENKAAYPRTFLVESVVKVKDKQEAIEKMFDTAIDLRRQAIVYDDIEIREIPLNQDESVKFMDYSENSVKLDVTTKETRLLVLSDSYYPTWNAYVNGNKTEMHQVNYNLRGIVIPKGEHKVVFKISWM